MGPDEVTLLSFIGSLPPTKLGVAFIPNIVSGLLYRITIFIFFSAAIIASSHFKKTYPGSRLIILQKNISLAVMITQHFFFKLPMTAASHTMGKGGKHHA